MWHIRHGFAKMKPFSTFKHSPYIGKDSVSPTSMNAHNSSRDYFNLPMFNFYFYQMYFLSKNLSTYLKR